MFSAVYGAGKCVRPSCLDSKRVVLRQLRVLELGRDSNGAFRASLVGARAYTTIGTMFASNNINRYTSFFKVTV